MVFCVLSGPATDPFLANSTLSGAALRAGPEFRIRFLNRLDGLIHEGRKEKKARNKWNS